ncbi:MAG: hypothetical protein OXF75_02440 [Acidimicrobiaceae bacterium]|nr:hypothetical protein [Acidimicrobiaceae bacterium]
MTTIEAPLSDLERRVRLVRGPKPRLSRERNEALTPRQREILDQLTELVGDGFCHLTMADLATRLNCSLRTLYGMAESRGELVLLAIDRNLWNIGRSATRVINERPNSPLEAIRAYLSAANVAVSRTTPAFARDLEAVSGGPELFAAHNEYLVDVTRELLDLAVEHGEIAAVNTAVVARALASLGRHFSEADVVAELCESPKDAADHVLDIMLNGLAQSWSTQDRPRARSGSSPSGARKESHARL